MPFPGCPRPVCTSADVSPCSVSEASFCVEDGSIVSGLGVNVLSAGAVPAGSVFAWNSGVESASEAMTPGLC
jgi:hypothetical protein